MNIKLKISGFLARLFGWEKEESYEVNVPLKHSKEEIKVEYGQKFGPCTEEKQKEEFERHTGGDGIFNTELRDKLERRIAENKIRNDTARSIRGIK